jgi:hypothetical protein
LIGGHFKVARMARDCTKLMLMNGSHLYGSPCFPHVRGLIGKTIDLSTVRKSTEASDLYSLDSCPSLLPFTPAQFKKFIPDDETF